MLFRIFFILLSLFRIILTILVNLKVPSYARKNDTIFINCSTDTIPLFQAADIYINSVVFTKLRAYMNKCFAPRAVCVPDVCACSPNGYWFAHKYTIDMANGTSRITCAMRFRTNVTTIVSDSIELNIIDFRGPHIRIDGNIPLNTGSEAHVVCEVFTQLKGVRIAWNCVKYDNVNQRTRAKIYQSTITFKVKPYHQNETCICAGIFKEFQATAALRLLVDNKPVLTTSNSSYCNTSSSVKLYCTIVGEQSTVGFHPWTHMFNGVPVRYLNGVNFVNTSTLEISNCTYQDAGKYFCNAWNKYNENIYNNNSSTTLTVNGPPNILSANVLRTHLLNITVDIYSTSIIEKPVWIIMSDQQEFATVLNSTFRSTAVSLPVYKKIIACQGYITTLITNDFKDLTYTVLIKNLFGETRKRFIKRQELAVSYDCRILILIVSVFGAFFLATTVTLVILRRRQCNSVVHIVGPLEHLATIPVYHSAPESQNEYHVYERTNPQYLEIIDDVQELHYSEVNNEEGEIYLPENDIDEDYEEID